MDRMIPADEYQGLLECQAIVAAINELRKDPGACVMINCPNEDGSGPDNESVEVTDDWTDWWPRTFRGRTVSAALDEAVKAKRSAENDRRCRTLQI